jgi:pantoate kinase
MLHQPLQITGFFEIDFRAGIPARQQAAIGAGSNFSERRKSAVQLESDLTIRTQ